MSDSNENWVQGVANKELEDEDDDDFLCLLPSPFFTFVSFDSSSVVLFSLGFSPFFFLFGGGWLYFLIVDYNNNNNFTRNSGYSVGVTRFLGLLLC